MLYFFLDKLTVFCITGIVITQITMTNGLEAGTAWLFVAYGGFYLVRLFLYLVKEAGSIEDLLERK